MASRFFEREFATPQDQEKRQRIVQELQRIRDFGVQVGCGWDRIGCWIFFKDRLFGKFHACLPGEMIHFLSFGFLECSPLPTYFWIFVLNFHPENWGNDPFCLGNSNMFLGIFTPTYPGEMIGPILTIIFFQMGWLTPPTRLYMYWLQKPLSAIII